MSVWGFLMASHKHCSAPLDALNREEVPIGITPQEVLSLMGVEALSHPLLAFSNEEFPFDGATHTSTNHCRIRGHQGPYGVD